MRSAAWNCDMMKIDPDCIRRLLTTQHGTNEQLPLRSPIDKRVMCGVLGKVKPSRPQPGSFVKGRGHDSDFRVGTESPF